MKRKPYLLVTNGIPKSEWKEAYRYARVLKNSGQEPDYSKTGAWWKAQLIIFNERDAFDWNSTTAADKLWMQKFTDDLITEILAEEANENHS